MHAAISYLFLAISIAALGYSCVALWCLIAFWKRRIDFERSVADGRANSAAPDGLPPMTILKPVSGDERGLPENLASFCVQDYPQFQVVFGVPDAGDAAALVVDGVARRFPHVAVARITGRGRAPNFKVAQLLDMMGAAAHDIIVVADSDTKVDARYLRSLAPAFAETRTGAVTCVYRGAPRAGTASALGALMIDGQFIPSVLVAALGEMRFCLGATMAVTRKALDAIGGFASLQDYLADDQMLGELVHRAGSRVALAPYVVEHMVDEPDLRALWAHELRWARTSRAARPRGYAGYFLTFAWPPALVYLLLSGAPILGGALLALALSMRLALHYVSRAALGAGSPDAAWLIPLRDLMGLAVWISSFFGRDVRWRDRDLRIDEQGRIVEKAETR